MDVEFHIFDCVDKSHLPILFYASTVEKLRRAIPIRKHVGVAIWRLATNSDYRTMGHLFGISTASVCLILDEFCNAMATLMLPRYIRIPIHVELINSSG